MTYIFEQEENLTTINKLANYLDIKDYKNNSYLKNPANWDPYIKQKWMAKSKNIIFWIEEQIQLSQQNVENEIILKLIFIAIQADAKLDKSIYSLAMNILTDKILLKNKLIEKYKPELESVYSYILSNYLHLHEFEKNQNLRYEEASNNIISDPSTISKTKEIIQYHIGEEIDLNNFQKKILQKKLKNITEDNITVTSYNPKLATQIQFAISILHQIKFKIDDELYKKAFKSVYFYPMKDQNEELKNELAEFLKNLQR